MNSFAFRDIINGILDAERIDLTALALKANADRSYISKVINSKKKLEVGAKVIGKISRAFPEYFKKNNENNMPVSDGEPTPMQIFHLLAKTLDSHGRILDRIENKMAKEDTLARMEISLTRTLAGALTVSKGQVDAMKEIRDLFSQVLAQKKPPSEGADKSQRRTDGGAEKKGKNPA